MSRKTFSVEAFKERVNGFLLADFSRSSIARQALMTQLEAVLHETGNYNGFTYLSADELGIPNLSPGINTQPNGQQIEDYDQRFAGTDRTRVKYF